MSVHESESAAGWPTGQAKSNKALIERAFQDVFVSDAFDQRSIARYFSPCYVQKTDGRALDLDGFVAHVRELKRTLKNVKITFERMVAEGASVVSIHRAEADKVAGGRISIRVFALFVIEEGRIVLCDELTCLEQGAPEDHDLASRMPVPPIDLNTSCPVCGYDLGFEPWRGDSASDEICPSCGIQFGYSDSAGGGPEARKALYSSWRQKWIVGGMKWRGIGRKPPRGWDPTDQLKRIGVTP